MGVKQVDSHQGEKTQPFEAMECTKVVVIGDQSFLCLQEFL